MARRVSRMRGGGREGERERGEEVEWQHGECATGKCKH